MRLFRFMSFFRRRSQPAAVPVPPQQEALQGTPYVASAPQPEAPAAGQPSYVLTELFPQAQQPTVPQTAEPVEPQPEVAAPTAEALRTEPFPTHEPAAEAPWKTSAPLQWAVPTVEEHQVGAAGPIGDIEVESASPLPEVQVATVDPVPEVAISDVSAEPDLSPVPAPTITDVTPLPEVSLPTAPAVQEAGFSGTEGYGLQPTPSVDLHESAEAEIAAADIPDSDPDLAEAAAAEPVTTLPPIEAADLGAVAQPPVAVVAPVDERAGLRRLGSDALGVALWRQLLFAEVVGERPWSLDVPAARLSFGSDLSFPVQFIGTSAAAVSSSTEPAAWTWAWAETESLPAIALTLVGQVWDLGAEQDVAELTDESTSLDGATAWYLALIATAAASPLPVYRVAHAGGALFMAIEGVALPGGRPTAPVVAACLSASIRTTYPLDHRALVESFCSAADLWYASEDASSGLIHCAGGAVTVAFGPTGELSDIGLRESATV